MRIVPLYNTRGEVGALLDYPNLFSATGEWIGVVTPDRKVFSVLGYYVGQLSDDRRILRRRTVSGPLPHIEPPAPIQRITPPASTPLSPMLSELTYSTIDVLLEEPERLHTLDVGELRPDLD
jgi:hypothetical protein